MDFKKEDELIKQDAEYALAEEPLSTFKRVGRRKCPICKEFGLIR